MNKLSSAPNDIDVLDPTAKCHPPEQLELTRPTSLKQPPLSQAFQGAFTAGAAGRFLVEGAHQRTDGVFASMSGVFAPMSGVFAPMSPSKAL